MGKAKPSRRSKKSARPQTETSGWAPLPVDVVGLGRNDYLAAAVPAVIALSVYLCTLPPTVTGEDSGEFISAVYTLGIAHPPGYPLYCMLGKLFTILLPFHTIAWRVAFMSAFFGAATCFGVCLLVIKLTNSRIAGVVSGAILAVSSEFWKWSVVAETYTLNAALMVLAVLLLLAWYETRHSKFIYRFAFVYGLGLCNHHTTHLLGPIFALFILSIDRRPWHRWHMYLFMLVITALVWGFVHLYLPIRAAFVPYNNWGNPSTWENFWNVVTREEYLDGFTQAPRSLHRLAQQLGVLITHFGSQFTPWMAWLPLVGIYPLWKRNRYVLGLVLAISVSIVFGIIVITNFGFDKVSICLNTKFWVPAYVMAAVLIGIGLAWTGSNQSLKRVVLPLGVVAFILPLTAHYTANDKSQYYFVRDYALDIFKTLDENAVYFPLGDNATFPLMYLQAVEGVRPDVSIGRQSAALEVEMPREAANRIAKLPPSEQTAAMKVWMIENGNRPVYFAETIALSGVSMIPTGLIVRATRPNQPITRKECWGSYILDSKGPSDSHIDMSAQELVYQYHAKRAEELIAQDDKEQALQHLAKAGALAGGLRDLVNDVGRIYSIAKEFDAAKDYYHKTLNIDPDHELTLRSLAELHQSLGELDEAKACFDRIAKLKRRR